eukprot:TRINITY_DN72800_c0_g1_i1.p1 TRINITY_DN72800_c0_g1~~TRINITY_DN72800_c0_g1_i1.p1  ORF type:complete len:196 (-),score=38.90 TRINITY_DN72800_c0_g1_i1:55-642(-)
MDDTSARTEDVSASESNALATAGPFGRRRQPCLHTKDKIIEFPPEEGKDKTAPSRLSEASTADTSRRFLLQEQMEKRIDAALEAVRLRFESQQLEALQQVAALQKRSEELEAQAQKVEQEKIAINAAALQARATRRRQSAQMAMRRHSLDGESTASSSTDMASRHRRKSVSNDLHWQRCWMSDQRDMLLEELYPS